MPASLSSPRAITKTMKRHFRQNCPFSFFSVGHGPVQQLDQMPLLRPPFFSSLLVLVPVQQLVDGGDPSFFFAYSSLTMQ
jgi:hypothetical protein